MPLKPVPIDRFPGLDLRQDPSEWPGALDVLNVEFIPGGIRSRPGSLLFNSTVTDAFFLFASETTGGSVIIAVSDTFAGGGNTYVLNTSGGIISTLAGVGSVGDLNTSAVSIGSPAFSYVYLQTGGTIRRWNGSTWATPAGMPTSPGVLSLSPTDNRLVVISGSRVSFSDPGAPEVFGANNYVELRPGDGEVINGAAVFNNQLFVFKRTKFFVFYGTSTDPSTGQPVFNYRTVEGIGKIGSAQSVAVGPDGVYFLGLGGIYRTAGGMPVRISDPMRPFFSPMGPFGGLELVRSIGAHPYWTRHPHDPIGTHQVLHWYAGKLYASLSTVQRSVTALLVFDPALNVWSYWEMNSQGFVSLRNNRDGRPALFVGRGGSGMVEMSELLTQDADVDFPSLYRSGFMDFGTPGPKTIRETLLEGTGTPILRWSRDYGTLDGGTTMTLGTAPALGRSRQSVAVQGRRFSYQLESARPAWTVNYIEPHIMAERPVWVS